MELPPLTQSFVLHFGEMGGRWGINRTVGQIYALLFVSDRPPACRRHHRERGSACWGFRLSVWWLDRKVMRQGGGMASCIEHVTRVGDRLVNGHHHTLSRRHALQRSRRRQDPVDALVVAGMGDHVDPLLVVGEPDRNDGLECPKAR